VSGAGGQKKASRGLQTGSLRTVWGLPVRILAFLPLFLASLFYLVINSLLATMVSAIWSQINVRI
jgi:hypothetical protein